MYAIFFNPHLLVQVLPSPEYPDSHAHVNDPSVSVQTALSWQSSTSRLHSFLSKSWKWVGNWKTHFIYDFPGRYFRVKP